MNSKILVLLTHALYTMTTFASAQRTMNLRFSVRNLPNFDIFNGSPDPYAVVHYSLNPTEQFIRIGETEALDDVNEAVWAEIFAFHYAGTGSQQGIKVDIMDEDIDEDDNIGHVEFSLTQIATSFGMTIEVEIIPSGNGFVKVTGNYVKTSTDQKSI